MDQIRYTNHVLDMHKRINNMTNAKKKAKAPTTTFIVGDLVIYDARADGRDDPLNYVGRVMLVEKDQLVLKLPTGRLIVAYAENCSILNI